jgi:nitrous oxidase accessory protein NosD
VCGSVVESTPTFIRVADKPRGEPIRFQTAAGPQTRLIHKLSAVHLGLYAPHHAGPGKGGVDITCASNVRITGCKLSALGDTMHVQRCHNVVFANNQILGSRMGAFFIAEYCKNVTVTGNTVDGTNGSRVMSVERSTEDITILGNTFRNGGRGSWINQPKNLVLEGNVFVNNTTKCERDPQRGRRTFVTGDYETYAELYFTTYEPEGRYGNVVVRNNIFITGPEASHAIEFHSGGDTLSVTGNVFAGAQRTIAVGSGCTNVVIRDNQGLEESK